MQAGVLGDLFLPCSKPLPMFSGESKALGNTVFRIWFGGVPLDELVCRQVAIS